MDYENLKKMNLFLIIIYCKSKVVMMIWDMILFIYYVVFYMMLYWLDEVYVYGMLFV